MKPIAQATFDVIRTSQSPENLITVVFAQSSAHAYPLAVELARGATEYGESTVGKKTIHMAAFARTKDQAQRAAAVLKLIMSWKTTQVFTQEGMAPHPYEIAAVLECYVKSLNANDRRAHCQWTYDGQAVPCRYLAGWFEGIADEIAIHPASRTDQIQALAVRKGCSWCPNFRC